LLVHRAIRKYGFPTYRILCVGPRDYIVKLEALWIAASRACEHKFGYNVDNGGSSPSLTPAIAAKISAANKGRLKGRKHPPEFGAKISAAKMGVKFSPEHRARISAGKKGRPGIKGRLFSPEHRARLSAAHKGHLVSQETRAKMSASRKGQPKPPFSDHHRAKISAARIGRKCPEVAAANKKRKGMPKMPFTDQHRANMSAAAKNRHSSFMGVIQHDQSQIPLTPNIEKAENK
jgi:hypothetical protein